jgi:hypothetical protein
VYVLRLQTEGAQLARLTDVLAFVKAFGQTSPWGYELFSSPYDCRGVLVHERAPQKWDVDLVLTYTRPDWWWMVEYQPFSLPGTLHYKAETERPERMMATEELQKALPGLRLVDSSWCVVESPQGEIDFWQRSPKLWDSELDSFTESFAAGEGIYYGTDGVRQRKWQPPSPPAWPPEPNGPGPGPEPKPKESSAVSAGAVLLFGAAALAVLVYVLPQFK